MRIRVSQNIEATCENWQVATNHTLGVSDWCRDCGFVRKHAASATGDARPYPKVVRFSLSQGSLPSPFRKKYVVDDCQLRARRRKRSNKSLCPIVKAIIWRWSANYEINCGSFLPTLEDVIKTTRRIPDVTFPSLACRALYGNHGSAQSRSSNKEATAARN